MELEILVDLRVEYSPVLNKNITPLFKRSWLWNESLKIFNSIWLVTILRSKRIWVLFLGCNSFRKKLLPHPQLLWWAQWFSQWDFQTKNIKGTTNIIADYFSCKPLKSLMPIPIVYPLEPVHDLLFEVQIPWNLHLSSWSYFQASFPPKIPVPYPPLCL